VAALVVEREGDPLGRVAHRLGHRVEPGEPRQVADEVAGGRRRSAGEVIGHRLVDAVADQLAEVEKVAEGARQAGVVGSLVLGQERDLPVEPAVGHDRRAQVGQTVERLEQVRLVRGRDHARHGSGKPDVHDAGRLGARVGGDPAEAGVGADGRHDLRVAQGDFGQFQAVRRAADIVKRDHEVEQALLLGRHRGAGRFAGRLGARRDGEVGFHADLMEAAGVAGTARLGRTPAVLCAEPDHVARAHAHYGVHRLIDRVGEPTCAVRFGAARSDGGCVGGMRGEDPIERVHVAERVAAEEQAVFEPLDLRHRGRQGMGVPGRAVSKPLAHQQPTIQIA